MKIRCGCSDMIDLAFGLMNLILGNSQAEVAVDARRRV